jgi:hypothetical protein
MGLLISRSIVESRGEHLWAKPDSGRGAKFSFHSWSLQFSLRECLVDNPLGGSAVRAAVSVQGATPGHLERPRSSSM